MSTIRADNYANRTGTSQITADTLLQGTAKAWLNLKGTGTIALRDGFNISSLVDVNVGSYAANLASAAPNGNYAVVSGSYPTASSWESTSCGTNTLSQFVLFCTSFTGAGAPSRQDSDSMYASLMSDP